MSGGKINYSCAVCGKPASVSQTGQIARNCDHESGVTAKCSATVYGKSKAAA